jgi:hypothetical protein
MPAPDPAPAASGVVHAFAWLLLLLNAAGIAQGQTLRGQVIDAKSLRPVPSAEVRLLAAGEQLAASAVADDSGRFALEADTAGEYSIRVERIGYAAIAAGPIRLAAGATTGVLVRMAVDAVPLDALTVVAEAMVPWLDRAGFYERKKYGTGRTIEREAILERNPRHTSDLLRGIPGVRIVSRHDGSDVVLRAGGLVSLAGNNKGGYCAPQVFLDGLVVSHAKADPRERFDIDSLLTGDIEAIEVYTSPSQVPPQYGGAFSMCGVILFWTRT